MDNSIKMDLFTVLLLIRVMLRNIFNESLYFTNFACLPLSSLNDGRKWGNHHTTAGPWLQLPRAWRWLQEQEAWAWELEMWVQSGCFAARWEPNQTQLFCFLPTSIPKRMLHGSSTGHPHVCDNLRFPSFTVE